jgi:hypothetical protein
MHTFSEIHQYIIETIYPNLRPFEPLQRSLIGRRVDLNKSVPCFTKAPSE